MAPTAAQVWEAITTDPKFVMQMPEGSPQREAIKPFVKASVTVLEAHMENAATLQSIMDAKMAFLKHSMENNLLSKMSEAMGMDMSMFEGIFTQLMQMLEGITANLQAFLEENGVTEEQVMLSAQIGLSAENQQKWRDGTLTIADIMRTQPGVILQNDS